VDESLGAIFPSFQSVLQKMSHPKGHVNSYSRDAMLSRTRRFDGFLSKGRSGLCWPWYLHCSYALRCRRSGFAQEKKVAQKNGVDISKNGGLRALASTSMEISKKSDLAPPPNQHRAERLWDKAEEYGGDTALAKTNRSFSM